MWLLELEKQTKEFEAPQSYFIWSALASVSAIVKDNVWIELAGELKLYPNIYVILYGPSGVRKSMPVNMARRIVDSLECTRVVQGRFSIQALLHELGQSRIDIEAEVEDSDSCAFICSSEFAASVVKDTQAITILTDLHDRHYNEGVRKNMLKSGGEVLRDPTITLLGACNDDMWKDVVSSRDLKGGFLGRIFLIDEYETGTLNSLMFEQDGATLRYNQLVQPILNRKNLKGAFEFGKDARQYHHDWYMNYFKGKKIDDETGSQLRISDKILKVAMLMSLCENDKMTIKEHHIKWARNLCMPTLQSAARIAKDQTLSLIHI